MKTEMFKEMKRKKKIKRAKGMAESVLVQKGRSKKPAF